MRLLASYISWNYKMNRQRSYFYVSIAALAADLSRSITSQPQPGAMHFSTPMIGVTIIRLGHKSFSKEILLLWGVLKRLEQ